MNIFLLCRFSCVMFVHQPHQTFSAPDPFRLRSPKDVFLNSGQCFNIKPLALCLYQPLLNFFGKRETVLQQVSPLKPHCGKTENAADLSAWSIFTRRRRYSFFFSIYKQVSLQEKEEDQIKREEEEEPRIIQHNQRGKRKKGKGRENFSSLRKSICFFEFYQVKLYLDSVDSRHDFS